MKIFSINKKEAIVIISVDDLKLISGCAINSELANIYLKAGNEIEIPNIIKNLLKGHLCNSINFIDSLHCADSYLSELSDVLSSIISDVNDMRDL